ncbi:TPA: hypothetical protein ACGZ99_003575, partial [Elizabethkingia anophelis]
KANLSLKQLSNLKNEGTIPYESVVFNFATIFISYHLVLFKGIKRKTSIRKLIFNRRIKLK